MKRIESSPRASWMQSRLWLVFWVAALPFTEGGCPPEKNVASDSNFCGPVTCEQRECGTNNCRPSVCNCEIEACGDNEGHCPDGFACTPEGLCEEAGCIPSCVGRDCGDDMCAGSCGACESGMTCNEEGKCEGVCVAACDGLQCGDDGCGGTCGMCGVDDQCMDGRCVPLTWTCLAAHYGDGNILDCNCGAVDPDATAAATETLRGCELNEICDSTGACVRRVPAGWTCAPALYANGGLCECTCGVPDPDCAATGGVTDTCESRSCNSDGTCATCVPDCDGKTCGSDGCSGLCGTCPDAESCVDGTCQSRCVPLPLLCLINRCGSDGCGGTCGTCNGSQQCSLGQCVERPVVAGADSCAGRCGQQAPSGCLCDAACAQRGDCCADQALACCVSECGGKLCGSDGCGGSCGSCGFAEMCVADSQCVPVAPAGLTFLASRAVYTVGQVITDNEPRSTGGVIAMYGISPALPAGLIFSMSTGVISGTPTTVSADRVYTIIATNISGTASVSVNIQVNPAAPATLTYASNPVTYTQGMAIAANTPTTTGGPPDLYLVMPSLPAGLSLSSSTGVISGTPSAVTPAADYTIAAGNVTGFAQTTVNIGVRVAPPAGLSYASTPVTYTQGVAIADNAPSSTGGAIASYAITPALPTGLSLSTSTGVISGTPSVVSAARNYSVTATNTTGSTATTVNLGVIAAPTAPWAQQAYVKAANNDANTANMGSEYVDHFSQGVAIDGDLMVVGAPLEDSNQVGVTNGSTASADNSSGISGAAYIYRRSGSAWVQEAYLKAGNAEDGDQFGGSVAISGNTVVVGAMSESSNQTSVTNGAGGSADNSAPGSGAAYVFRYNGAAWAQEAYLKASNAEGGDQFGSSVAIRGDIIVVGANNEASNQTGVTNSASASADNSASASGAAYVYTRTSSTWSEQAYLKAGNTETNDQFGTSVAVSGTTIVVGATGESSGDIAITNGAGGSSDNSVFYSGAAYVFTWNGSAWSQQAYLKPPNPTDFGGYATSVTIDSNTIIVGAPGEASAQTTITNGMTASSDASAVQAGAAYVYVRSGSTWSQQAYLKASNADAVDNYGAWVSLSGNRAAIGAFGEGSAQSTVTTGPGASSDNTLSSAGAVYVLERSGSNWSQVGYLKPANPDSGDEFGRCVGISATTVVVGARQESSAQTTITNGPTASSNNDAFLSGAAYVYYQ